MPVRRLHGMAMSIAHGVPGELFHRNQGAAPALASRAKTTVGDAALFVLFAALDAHWVARWRPTQGAFGLDGAIYRTAAEAWLSGGDPWSITVLNTYFAGPPPTLLVAVPFIPLGNQVTSAAWIVIAFAASVWAIRRLGMPLWWILFPHRMPASA